MAYDPKDFDIFIGIDVDQKSFVFTVKDHNQMKRSYKIPASPENLYHHIRNSYNNKRVICAYEVGGSGYHLHDYLVYRDTPCLMFSPPSIPRSPNMRVKTNRLDSEKITDELQKGSLPSIRIPDEEYRELRHLVRLREDYVRMSRISKQRIKGLLLFSNLHTAIKDPIQNWSARYIQELKKLPCSPATRQRLDFQLQDLAYAREHILSVLKELKSFCQNHPAIERNIHYLRSIPGIGFVTAVTLMANIGNPQYLKNVSELGAFMGLVPSEDSTGDTQRRGSITHLGDRALRSMLIEVAWTTSRLDRQLNQFYNRIRAEHHPAMGARKAIGAVARKLTMIIYRILKDQREYTSH